MVLKRDLKKGGNQGIAHLLLSWELRFLKRSLHILLIFTTSHEIKGSRKNQAYQGRTWNLTKHACAWPLIGLMEMNGVDFLLLFARALFFFYFNVGSNFGLHKSSGATPWFTECQVLKMVSIRLLMILMHMLCRCHNFCTSSRVVKYGESILRKADFKSLLGSSKKCF